MITVTASPINTFTPVVDGAGVTSSPTTTGVISSEGFSTALNTQMGLLVQPTTDVAVLMTPTSAMLAAITTTPPTAVTVPVIELTPDAALVTTPPTLLQTDSTTNASSINPTIINNTALATMSAEDTAILSTVTDTLKFITAGAKLGDTLPAGQTVQLPSANAATILTQQSMQTAVQQAVTNTQVNTPASVLVQQIMPVQTIQPPVTTAAQIDVPEQLVQVIQTPVTTAAQIDVPEQPVQAIQTPVTTAAQIDVPEQMQAIQTPVTTAAQIDMPEQMQTIQPPVTTAAQIDVPEQMQAIQTPVTTAAQIDVPEQPVQAIQTPVAVVQGDVSEQMQTIQPPTTITTLDIVTERTQSPPIQITAATPVEVAPQSLNSVTTAQLQTIPTIQVKEETSALNQPVLTLKTAIKTPVTVTTDAAIESQLAAEVLPLIAGQGVSAKQKVSDTVALTTTNESEHKTTENNPDAPVVQIVVDAIIAPLVTAQTTPVQVEAQKVAVETSSETTTTAEKPTLTSAKNLLMDAVANRNTSGDAANNGNNNNGSNTPSNPALQSDALRNQTADNKQSATDLRSFASLLTAEKSDVIGASATASTSDKSAPQVITAAVNKLVQDTKVDVPAMTKPLSHPEWNQDMGERIVWMNTRGISSAEIKMNPQNMGPITVRIDMNQDQATVAFTAQNSDVRAALEASIPKLRDMLNAQNVTLAEVNVSQQSTSNDSERSQQQTAQMMADASANGQGNRQSNQEVDAQGNPVNTNNNADGTVDEFVNGQVIDTNGTNGLLSIYA